MKDNRTDLNNAIQWEDFGMPYSSSQGVVDNKHFWIVNDYNILNFYKNNKNH